MSYRKLIYISTAIVFLPALLLMVVAMAFVPTIVLQDLTKGHWETIVLLLPLIGGGVGLGAVILVICDIAGKSISAISGALKRLGLMVGLLSELSVIAWFTPNLEPFLYYWLPQLVGGVVLFALSYKYTANNAAH